VKAAVSSGNKDEVTRLLQDKGCDGLSKSLKKKLIKDAEINAKKIAKGGGGGAPAQQTAPSAEKVNKKGKVAVGPPASAPIAPAASSGGPTGAAERALVTDLLGCIESLALPEGAMAALRANEAALASSIAPQVATLRNQAYSAGFVAVGSRSA
jgi:hypothetical protein